MPNESRAPITVRFKFTLEELAEVTERGITSRPAHLRRRRNAAILLGLVAAGGAYLATMSRPNAGLLPMLAAFVIAAGGSYFLVPRFYRPRIVELLKERVQGEGPFECVVTLDANGCTFEQLDMIITRKWRAIRDVRDGDKGVDLTGRDGTISLVRDRAFATPFAREEFVAYAKEMIASAH